MQSSTRSTLLEETDTSPSHTARAVRSRAAREIQLIVDWRFWIRAQFFSITLSEDLPDGAHQSAKQVLEACGLVLQAAKPSATYRRTASRQAFAHGRLDRRSGAALHFMGIQRMLEHIVDERAGRERIKLATRRGLALEAILHKERKPTE